MTKKRQHAFNRSEYNAITWAHFWELLARETDDCVVWKLGTWDYGQIHLPGRRHWGVHALALEIRTGAKPTSRHEAAHGPCHNPRCMNYRHLSWKTRAENIADKLRDGTHFYGEANPGAKLTVDKVIQIRTLKAAGERSVVVGEKFGISRQAVDSIASRRNWKHVA